MNSVYRQILKKAWQITKKFRYLWPLGIFAAFLGNGGEYQVLFKQLQTVAEQQTTLSIWQDNLKAILPPLNLSAGNLIPVILNLIFALLVLGLFLWLVIAAFGGIIKGAAEANQDQTNKTNVLLKIGSRKFWPLLGLNVIAKVIVYGFLILILAPLLVATFAQGQGLINALITMLIFLIFIPLTIMVSLVTKFAAAEVMLNNQKFWDAFKIGWRIFAANWLVSLEMALVIFIINILVSLALIIVSLLVLSPFFFFGIWYTISSPYLFNTLMYIALGSILAVSLLVGAALATFQISSWTLLYLRLTGGEKTYSKIVRLVAGWPDKFKKQPKA